MTSMSEMMPIALSKPAGSGHRASHHPAVGISVPSKKPGCLLVVRKSLLETSPFHLLLRSRRPCIQYEMHEP
jgi:hypothetical protein